MLGPKFLDELDMVPESKLNSTAALVDSVMGQYTGVDLLLKDHLTTDICRGPFTRYLGESVENKLIMKHLLIKYSKQLSDVCPYYG